MLWLEQVGKLINKPKEKEVFHLEEAIEGIHELVKKDWYAALDRNKLLSEEEMIECYTEAVSLLIKKLNTKKVSLQTILSHFREQLDFFIFDKETKKQLASGQYSKKNLAKIYSNKFFEKLAESPFPSKKRVKIFQQAFDKFWLFIQSVNFRNQHLQELFFDRLNDIYHLEILKENGNQDKGWQQFLKNFHHLKFDMLRRYKMLRLAKDGIHIEDIFNDAVLGFENNLKKGTFRGESALKTYFFSIFQRKCVDTIRSLTTKQKNQVASLDDENIKKSGTVSTPPDLSFEQQEYLAQLKALFKKAVSELGKNCKDLLELAAQGLSNFAIYQDLGWESEAQARTQRYNCLKKLKSKLPNWKGNNQAILEVLILFHHGEL